MNSNDAEQAEVDALIAQLSSSTSRTNLSTSPENNSASGAGGSERKRVYIRQNSGSNSNAHFSGSPTDAQKHLLQKNTRIFKKNDRKSRQGLFDKCEEYRK